MPSSFFRFPSVSKSSNVSKIVLWLFAGFALTGCLSYEGDLSVSESGQLNGAFEWTVTEAALDAAPENDPNRFAAGLADNPLLPFGIRTETINGAGRVGQRFVFDEVETVNLGEVELPFAVIVADDGHLDFTIDVAELNAADSSRVPDEAIPFLDPSTRGAIRVEFPYAVVETNGSVDGGVVTWRHHPADGLTMPAQLRVITNTEAPPKPSGTGGMPWTRVLLGFVIVGAVVWLFAGGDIDEEQQTRHEGRSRRAKKQSSGSSKTKATSIYSSAARRKAKDDADLSPPAAVQHPAAPLPIPAPPSNDPPTIPPLPTERVGHRSPLPTLTVQGQEPSAAGAGSTSPPPPTPAPVGGGQPEARLVDPHAAPAPTMTAGPADLHAAPMPGGPLVPPASVPAAPASAMPGGPLVQSPPVSAAPAPPLANPTPSPPPATPPMGPASPTPVSATPQTMAAQPPGPTMYGGVSDPVPAGVPAVNAHGTAPVPGGAADPGLTRDPGASVPFRQSTPASSPSAPDVAPSGYAGPPLAGVTTPPQQMDTPTPTPMPATPTHPALDGFGGPSLGPFPSFVAPPSPADDTRDTAPPMADTTRPIAAQPPAETVPATAPSAAPAPMTPSTGDDVGIEPGDDTRTQPHQPFDLSKLAALVHRPNDPDNPTGAARSFGRFPSPNDPPGR